MSLPKLLFYKRVHFLVRALLRIVPDFLTGLLGGLLPKGHPANWRRRIIPQGRSRVSRVVWKALLLLALCGGLAGAYFWYRKPSPTHSKQKSTAALNEDLDTAVSEALATAPDAPPRAWTAIVLHHSATARGSAHSFDAYHREYRGWRSLGYDFVIGNGTDVPDGSIEAGPRWRNQEAGAHAHSPEYNEHGIGICLVGNFDQQPPTEAQVRATCALIHALRLRYGIPANRIFGHKEIREGGSTSCPGALFPMRKFVEGSE